MSDTLNIFTRTSKVFYERVSNSLKKGKVGIEQFLFSTPDLSTSANFAIDKRLSSPYGFAFRNAGEQSHVRHYNPGSGVIIEVPYTSEKTPITEVMLDSVVAGKESTDSQESNEAELFKHIIDDYAAAHSSTKAKLSLDVVRTGKFSPLGLAGRDIGLEYDFGRDSSLDKTYDFTAGGATMDIGLGALYDAARAKGVSPDNLLVIMGSSWLTKFETELAASTKMRNNMDNVTAITKMIPEELLNTQGLYLVGQYRIPGRATPIWIATYSPEDQYTAYESASAEDFVPATSCLMINPGSKRLRVFRGVNVLNDAGRKVRTVQDLTFDTFTDVDPVQDWVRASTRYMFVPANIDHTAVSVGTFT